MIAVAQWVARMLEMIDDSFFEEAGERFPSKNRVAIRRELIEACLGVMGTADKERKKT